VLACMAMPVIPFSGRFNICRPVAVAIVALSLVSCGYPQPEAPGDASTSDGPGGPPCPTCQLLAVVPSTAHASDTIVLEGTFTDSLTVRFPGGVSRPATVLGPHRATVVVPDGAGSGDLTVTAGGSTLGPMPFSRVSFGLGVQSFQGYYQSTLETARYSAVTARFGKYLFIIGGDLSSQIGKDVERAVIAADGSLGRFTSVDGVSLVGSDYSAAAVGNYVYIIGGRGDSGPSTQVRRATVGADGSLTQFTVVTDTALVAARFGHASVMVGNYLYVLGGEDNASNLTSVERAVIGVDGSLGAFATVPGVTLATPRVYHRAIVAGNSVYIIGGRDNTATQAVERAGIHGDGSLDTFATVPGVALMDGLVLPAVAVVGSAVYVMGGSGSVGPATAVERAPINADGSLGVFGVVPTVSLAAAGSAQDAVVAQDYLYVIGGGDQSGRPSKTIQRASINGDGVLGTFATVAGQTLRVPRDFHTNVVVDNYLYVMGGANIGVPVPAVERAPIGADGALGAFETLSGVTLSTGRIQPTSARVRQLLYVVGGMTASIEQAPIDAAGNLGAFTPSGVNLTTSRYGHTMAVLGNNLYVIGGRTPSGLTGTLERSQIAADGSLGAFSTVSGVALTTPRTDHMTVAVGNFLYVIAGTGANGNTLNVERAPIGFDGTLGAFADAGVGLIVPVPGATATVVGNYLYVLGGQSPGSVDGSVQRAPVNPDGSLGAFAVANQFHIETPRQYHSGYSGGNFVCLLGGVALGVLDRIECTQLP
jgi:Kelch motif protein